MKRSRHAQGSTGRKRPAIPSTWSSWRSEHPEIWHAGPTESEIVFSLHHPDLAEIKGRVGRWRATFVVDLDEPTRCSVDVVVDAASLDTGEAERDAYARSTAFLDVARFPEIRFRSRTISSENGDRRLTITGDLTVRQTTREVSLMVERKGDESLWQQASKLAFKGRVSFQRLDFGLRWRGESEQSELVAGNVVDVDLRINIRRGPK